MNNSKVTLPEKVRTQINAIVSVGVPKKVSIQDYPSYLEVSVFGKDTSGRNFLKVIACPKK